MDLLMISQMRSKRFFSIGSAKTLTMRISPMTMVICDMVTAENLINRAVISGGEAINSTQEHIQCYHRNPFFLVPKICHFLTRRTTHEAYKNKHHASRHLPKPHCLQSFPVTSIQQIFTIYRSSLPFHVTSTLGKKQRRDTIEHEETTIE